MKLKNFLRQIPKVPLSALIFYLLILVLWRIGSIPSPTEVLIILENLYGKYGIIGLFIASFLEGIVYLGLYFPGSFIIALSVILSDGTFYQFFIISLTVAISLTITSAINYILGKTISSKNLKLENQSSKGIFASIIHPNILAFYFFISGIEKRNLKNILLVPILMIPYGFILAILFYSIKNPLRSALESPLVMITLILIWIIAAFVLHKNHKSNFIRNEVHQRH